MRLLWFADIKPKRAAELVARLYNHHDDGEEIRNNVFQGKEVPSRYQFIDRDSIYQWWKEFPREEKQLDPPIHPVLKRFFANVHEAKLLIAPYNEFDKSLQIRDDVLEIVLKKSNE